MEAQKHDYPSAAWRASYARRTGAERSNSTIKDPASNDISRGWCRLMGLTPLFIFVTCCLVARNLRVLDAFEARQAEDARRAAASLAPKRRHRRRRTLGDLVGAPPQPPAPEAPQRGAVGPRRRHRPGPQQESQLHAARPHAPARRPAFRIDALTAPHLPNVNMEGIEM